MQSVRKKTVQSSKLTDGAFAVQKLPRVKT
jgi:hypothetical protein